VELGRILWTREEWEVSLEPLEAVAGDPAAGFKTRYMLGVAYFKLGRFGEAAPHLEAARDADADDYRTRRTLAAVYDKLGRRDDAVREMEAAAAIGGDGGIRDREALALAYLEKGDMAAAETHLREVLLKKPGDVKTGLSLGAILEQGKRYSEAEEVYEALVKHHRRSAETWKRLARVRSKQGDHKGAITALKAAVKTGADDVRTRRLLAQELVRVGAEAEASKWFHAAWEADPGAKEAPDLLRSAATLAYRTGDHARAWALATDLAARYGDDAQTWRVAASAAVGMNDRAKVRAALEEVVALEPEDMKSVLMLAGLHLEAGEAGDAARAKALYRDAVTRDPKLAAGWAGLARIAEDAEDHASAAEHYRKVVEFKPDDASSHYGLAVALSNLQDGRGALAALGACVKADPALAPCHHARGLVHLSMGEEDAALKDLRRLRKLDRELARDLEARMK